MRKKIFVVKKLLARKIKFKVDDLWNAEWEKI